MMVGRQADLVVLSGEDRTFLEAQVRRHKAPRSLSDRCRMVLLCAEGLQSKEVAERLGVHEHTVGKWRRRFVQDGIEGLTDEYRAGRPRTVSDAQVVQVIERTLNTTPTDATHWSIRSMATEAGLSHTTIRRIWAAFGLQPHRSQTFKLSTDPLFVDKVHRSIGRQVGEIVFALAGRTVFADQPDLLAGRVLCPHVTDALGRTIGDTHANGGKAGDKRPLRAAPPTDLAPRCRRQHRLGGYRPVCVDLLPERYANGPGKTAFAQTLPEWRGHAIACVGQDTAKADTCLSASASSAASSGSSPNTPRAIK